MKIRRILLATDFSECSKHALDYACGWAAAMDARLVVLHAVEPVYYAAPFGPDANAPLLMSDQRRVAQQAIDELVSKLGERASRVAETLVATGPPPERIVAAAQEHDIDMIVIGTHGRSGLAHLLLGSVAERVIRTAQCPVLTVRADSSAETSA